MQQAELSPAVDGAAVVAELDIPACPEILIKVLAEMRRDDPDFGKIGNLISSDVSLAAATLETVNSAAFGLRSKIASVDKALTLLGLRNVKNVMTGLLLREALPVTESKALDRFWESSAGIAQTAALLAKPLGRLDREEAYTFALFRDGGLPLMVRHFEGYDPFYAAAAESAGSFTQGERERFGVDHARVGEHLARKWQLPDTLAEAIGLHHEYDRLASGGAADAVCRFVALGLAAEQIYALCTAGADSAEWAKGGSFALAALGASPADLEGHRDMVEGILGL